LLRFRIHHITTISEEVPMPFQVTVQRETATIGFDPPDLTDAKAGDAVFWLNADHHTTHQICPKDGVAGDWGDPVAPQASSMQVNVPAAGVYLYRCALHDDETGTLTVT
jgi:plastocyanin